MAFQVQDDLLAAIGEVAKGYELSSKLHMHLRSVIPRGDGRLESACRLSKEVQKILASTLEILKPSTSSVNTTTTTKKARFKTCSDPLALEIGLPFPDVEESWATSTKTVEAKATRVEDNSRNDSRKRNLHSGTRIDYESSNEVHQWKADGERNTKKLKLPRCTYKDDQGCPATKQAQTAGLRGVPSNVCGHIQQPTQLQEHEPPRP